MIANKGREYCLVVEGAYLMPSFGRYEVVARVAEVVRTRQCS